MYYTLSKRLITSIIFVADSTVLLSAQQLGVIRHEDAMASEQSSRMPPRRQTSRAHRQSYLLVDFVSVTTGSVSYIVWQEVSKVKFVTRSIARHALVATFHFNLGYLTL